MLTPTPNPEGQPPALPVKLAPDGLTIITASIGRDTLKRTQESVWNQRLKVKHLIVLDPDKISAGLTKTKGARKADTEWIAFVDDDDTIDPMFSSWWYDNKDDCDAMLFKCDNKVLGRVVPEPGYDTPETLYKSHLGMSMAIKRDIFLEHPYFNEREAGMAEEWPFIQWLRDERKAKIKVIDKVAYTIHQHGGRQ